MEMNSLFIQEVTHTELEPSGGYVDVRGEFEEDIEVNRLISKVRKVGTRGKIEGYRPHNAKYGDKDWCSVQYAGAAGRAALHPIFWPVAHLPWSSFPFSVSWLSPYA